MGVGPMARPRRAAPANVATARRRLCSESWPARKCHFPACESSSCSFAQHEYRCSINPKPAKSERQAAADTQRTVLVSPVIARQKHRADAKEIDARHDVAG